MSNESSPANPPSVAIPTTAEVPFDGSEGFDTILRTSDGMHFHVYRVVLSLSSVFFKSMFTLPQPPDAPVPVIDVSEHGKALDTLLRYCYPVKEPDTSNLDLVADVLEAAMKYEMSKATDILVGRLRSFVSRRPLKLYAVACRFHLEEIASLAAQEWRKISPKADDEAKDRGVLIDWKETITGSSYNADMADISAGAYFRLAQYVRTGEITSFVLPQAEPRELLTSDENNLDSTNPFNFSNSDFTILSSDGMEFHIHKIIIRLASPVLLKESLDSSDMNDRLQLPEDGETLSLLLRACYPSLTIGATFDVQKLTCCLRAAVKYEMMKIVEVIMALLKSRERTEPLDLFFSFIVNGFMKEGAEVSQSSLVFTPLTSLYHPLMEKIKAKFYHCWLEHRHGCLSGILKICASYENQGHYSSKSKWWNVMKPFDNFPYLAAPVVANTLTTLYAKSRSGPYGGSYSTISQSDCEITGDLYLKSIKFMAELESFIAGEVPSLENCLLNFEAVELDRI